MRIIQNKNCLTFSTGMVVFYIIILFTFDYSFYTNRIGYLFVPSLARIAYKINGYWLVAFQFVVQVKKKCVDLQLVKIKGEETPS